MVRSIKLEMLTKTIGGSKVINKVNLHIPSGEFFALLGQAAVVKLPYSA